MKKKEKEEIQNKRSSIFLQRKQTAMDQLGKTKKRNSSFCPKRGDEHERNKFVPECFKNKKLGIKDKFFTANMTNSVEVI